MIQAIKKLFSFLRHGTNRLDLLERQLEMLGDASRLADAEVQAALNVMGIHVDELRRRTPAGVDTSIMVLREQMRQATAILWDLCGHRIKSPDEILRGRIMDDEELREHLRRERREYRRNVNAMHPDSQIKPYPSNLAQCLASSELSVPAHSAEAPPASTGAAAACKPGTDTPAPHPACPHPSEPAL